MRDLAYYFQIAAEEAEKGMNRGEGGPFGACVVSPEGAVISSGHNQVLLNDPTAHAEIQAIRAASDKMNTYDLTGCVLFATGEPCPMCLSAIIWANIKKVYYANTVSEAGGIGFRDNRIYEFLRGASADLLELSHIPDMRCRELYHKYANAGRPIY